MLFSRKKKEAKKAKKAALNIRSRPVLGVPLSESALTNKSHDGIPVPVIVRLCIDYVDEFGLTVEGIYRISSPKTRLDELEKLANEYGVVVFEDPHEAAGLLKRFLRQLPENILTDKLIDKFDKASGACRCDPLKPCFCESSAKLKDLLHQLPIQNYFLLAYVFIHCQKIVMMSSENKMNIPALGVLLQQILDAPRNIVRIFLLNASELLNSNGLKANYLFENITLKRYIAPLTWQDHFPLTESGLNEELGKQESLLEDLKNQTLNTAKMKNEEKKAREEEKKRVVSNIAVINEKLKTLPKPLHSSSIESIMNEEEKKFEDEEKQLMTVNQVILEKNKSEMAAIASMLHQFNQNVGIKKIDPIDTTENIQDNCWIQECEEERKKRRILLLHIHSLQEQCTMLRASIERCNHEASSITQTKF